MHFAQRLRKELDEYRETDAAYNDVFPIRYDNSFIDYFLVSESQIRPSE